MRKVLVLCLLLAGCSASSKFYKDYDIGVEKQATVGSVMVTVSGQTKIAEHPTPITQQLIYDGVAARIAAIGYREYGEELTKPVYSQQLQYDLNESDLIIFQELTIQVIEATSKQIRFKVLTGPVDPNAPEGPGQESAPPKFPQ